MVYSWRKIDSNARRILLTSIALILSLLIVGLPRITLELEMLLFISSYVVMYVVALFYITPLYGLVIAVKAVLLDS